MIRFAAFAAAGLALCVLQAAAGELKPWPGGATPALSLPDSTGAQHALEAYRGKVVIVNFWASWCEPCREEMPSLNRLRRSFEGKPVAFLAVNVGEGAARIETFLKAVPLDFTVLLDRDSRVTKAWKVRLLPSTFIVARDGRVAYSFAGERDWTDAQARRKIDRLLEDAPLRASR